jgi:phage baseplate assembly protein W
MSTFDLSWNLVTNPGPEPEPAPFTPPAAVPGANLGQVELGCGIIAPFQRDGTGDWRNGCGEPIIRASVERILGVVSMSDYTHGELPWRPEFGSLANHLRHRAANEATADLARYYVIDALRIWEPRIAVLDAEAEYEDRQEPGAPPGKAMIVRILYNILGQIRGASTLVPNVLQTISFNTAA